MLDNINGTLESLCWTQDGSILSVSTSGGTVYNFLTKVPLVSASYGSKMVLKQQLVLIKKAYLGSLRTVSVVDSSGSSEMTIEVAIEPQFVALGPNHVQLNINNSDVTVSSW